MWAVLLLTVLGLMTENEGAVGAERSLGLNTPAVKVLVIATGRCPGLSQLDAENEAEKVLQQKTITTAQQLAEQWGNIHLTRSQALWEWSWLMEQPGVSQEVEKSCVPKDYAWIAERVMKVVIPLSVLRHWTVRLKQRAVARWHARLAGAGATLAIILAGMIGMVLLDRWTRGYARGLVVGGVFLGIGLTVASMWVWIVTMW